MPDYPMISARALGAMPRFFRAEAGARGLLRASAAAGLPPGIEQDERRFITQRSLMAFVGEGARLVGDEGLGLLLAQHLTPADYGSWGGYLLSAPTLADALQRAQRSLHWHSTGDAVCVQSEGDWLRFAYRFASAGAADYGNVAYCAAGVLISLVRSYLGAGWKPQRIDIDLPPPRQAHRASEAFGCEVRFGCRHVAVLIPAEDLQAPPAARPGRRPVSLADVRRARTGNAPTELVDIVREMLRAQLLTSTVSLDTTAAQLRLGPRTLQRRIDRQGLRFRDLVSEVRVQRARELLAERDVSITTIAAELGYSEPSHFARAFQRATGLSPRGFRRSLATA